MAKIFKIIETNRLMIRPLVMSDAKDYHKAELRSVNTMAPYWSWVDKNKTLEGTPVERLTGSFDLLKQSVMNLDFDCHFDCYDILPNHWRFLFLCQSILR